MAAKSISSKLMVALVDESMIAKVTIVVTIVVDEIIFARSKKNGKW